MSEILYYFYLPGNIESLNKQNLAEHLIKSKLRIKNDMTHIVPKISYLRRQK